MATFVLVHGSCHGGWCWKKVTPFLSKDGHNVYTPTLTGLGERSHLVSRNVGLDTHILDILQVLEYEDLSEVTLVGHSYGGLVIGGVAEVIDQALVPGEANCFAASSGPTLVEMPGAEERDPLSIGRKKGPMSSLGLLDAAPLAVAVRTHPERLAFFRLAGNDNAASVGSLIFFGVFAMVGRRLALRWITPNGRNDA